MMQLLLPRRSPFRQALVSKVTVLWTVEQGSMQRLLLMMMMMMLLLMLMLMPLLLVSRQLEIQVAQYGE
jgi:hypothetical protein